MHYPLFPKMTIFKIKKTFKILLIAYMKYILDYQVYSTATFWVSLMSPYTSFLLLWF